MKSPLKPIEDIASSVGIPEEYLLPYGRHIAKVDTSLLKARSAKKDGRLVLVTSMSPTPAGEGKTTLTIGLAQSFKLLGKKAAACIRQPSLGPLFGAKGGATGSGLSEALPKESISMQFTGDDYSIVAAHNLISSMMDSHIHHGNSLGIDPTRIFWPRVSSISDRALRRVRVALGENERVDEFHISAASEVMSILCLSTDIMEVKGRLEGCLLAYTKEGGPVLVRNIKAAGAGAVLLRDAINPNLVQSAEGAPVFVHGGPFGNISLGCSSLVATKLALKLADVVMTEAGFATDLGAEKFFDIQCRAGGIRPDAAVIVATLGALRLHGGAGDFGRPDREALLRGIDNLRKHIENIGRFGVPVAVALNRYKDDPDDEVSSVLDVLRGEGVIAHAVDVRDRGGAGGVEMAEAILGLFERKNSFRYLYELKASLEEKVRTIATEIYGASGVTLAGDARKEMEELERLGYGELPVCVAKTHRSLSDNPDLIGRPRGFTVTVRNFRIAAGAGFVVALSGKILLMPGLPEHPLAEEIDVMPDGGIRGI